MVCMYSDSILNVECAQTGSFPQLRLPRVKHKEKIQTCWCLCLIKMHKANKESCKVLSPYWVYTSRDRTQVQIIQINHTYSSPIAWFRVQHCKSPPFQVNLHAGDHGPSVYWNTAHRWTYKLELRIQSDYHNHLLVQPDHSLACTVCWIPPAHISGDLVQQMVLFLDHNCKKHQEHWIKY